MNKALKKAVPHWSKEVFKYHDIPISSVALTLELNYTYVSTLLSGVSRVTPEVEARLKELVERIEKSCSAPETEEEGEEK